MLPVLDLVAVAYQAYDETESFLESMQFVEVPFTLVVVDNASPDNRMHSLIDTSLEKIRKLMHCVDASRIFNDSNLGYARAANQGMRVGTAPYAGILNCDTRFLPEGIGRLVRHFKSDEKVGVIGPRTVDERNRFTHAGIVRDMLDGRDRHRGWLEFDRGQFRDTLSVPTVSGATFFVRRDMWNEMTLCPLFRDIAPDAVGAFLPTKLYYEETFCAYHARAHSWDVVYLGSVKMIHQWDRSAPGTNKHFKEAEDYFRKACAHHRIPLSW